VWPSEAERRSAASRRQVFGSRREEHLDLRTVPGSSLAILPLVRGADVIGLCEIVSTHGGVPGARRTLQALAGEAGLRVGWGVLSNDHPLNGNEMTNGKAAPVPPVHWSSSTAGAEAEPPQGYDLDGIHILIIDRHLLFADALRTLLEQRGGSVVGVAQDIDKAISMPVRPDVVLADLEPSAPDFPSTARRLCARFVGAKVLSLTPADARPGRDANRHGIHGSLSKDARLSELVRSIKAALNGDVVVPLRPASQGTSRVDLPDRHAALLAEQLTPREFQVLRLLVEGTRSDEIARRLGASPNTVRTHVQSVLTKLQVHSRLEAATFAVRHGLVKVPGERRPR
jgi:two-component system, NarL family, nitrate/nitrite response regulator NarL